MKTTVKNYPAHWQCSDFEDKKNSIFFDLIYQGNLGWHLEGGREHLGGLITWHTVYLKLVKQHVKVVLLRFLCIPWREAWENLQHAMGLFKLWWLIFASYYFSFVWSCIFFRIHEFPVKIHESPAKRKYILNKFKVEKSFGKLFFLSISYEQRHEKNLEG